MAIDGLIYEIVNEKAIVSGYDYITQDIIIPSTISIESINYPVVAINNNVFSGPILKSIVIPNSVTSIGIATFSGCAELTTIEIPNSVTSIEDYVFTSCTQLTTVTIPNSVTSIGSNSFSNCYQLSTITIPNSVTSIGDSAFSGDNLTSIDIPNSVITMGERVFSSCTQLTTATISNSITSINNYVFNGCTSLTSITIPDSVTSIGDGAFSNTGLTSITIPDSVTSIGDGAFANTSLTLVNIPDSVTNIGNSAFAGCFQLTTVNISNSITSIQDSVFNACTQLTSIIIPDLVISIGNSAFLDSGLTSIFIPKSVTSISNRAFANTQLTTVTIPNSVIHIGDNDIDKAIGVFQNSQLSSLIIEDGINQVSIGVNAFRDTLLTTVTIPKSIATIGNNAFSTVTNVCIQGNNNNYVNAFTFPLSILFYNNVYDLNTAYSSTTTISFNPLPVITFDSTTSSLIIPTICDTLPPLLLGSYNGQFIENYFSTEITVPLEFDVQPNTMYEYLFTITYNGLTILSIPVNSLIQTSSIISIITNTIDTTNTSSWINTDLQTLETVLKTNTYNALVSIQLILSSVFSSVSSLYSNIITTYGIFALPNTTLNLSKYAFGPTVMLLLPTTQNPINIGVILSSDGINTYVSGPTIPYRIFELGTSIMVNNYKVTLIANGSSGITVEYIPNNVPISPICFPAGTPVLTDQGYIPIDKITTQTLYRKPIKLSKTITKDKYLVCFEKDSLEKNVPFQRTLMSKDHMVYYKEFKLKAKEMIPYFEKVYKVKYTGEVLYNVLIDIHGWMKVNNMRCETLDPNHCIAKLYNCKKEHKINLKYI